MTAIGAPLRVERVLGAQAAPAIRHPRLRLLRTRQWVKNAFVLAPVVFAGLFRQPDALLRALAAAGLFCVAASAVYVLNDLLDVEGDRAHPAKRASRPLAAGAVTPAGARALLGGLGLLVVAGSAAQPAVGGVVALYLAVNLAYSLKLKQVPVVDLFCVATGFVLRVWAGAVAVAVPLSSWMLITTLCLALYLAAVKRRQEILATVGSGGRSVLSAYTPALLDRYAQTASAGAIVFYALYVIDVRPGLVVSIPLVLLGFFRYAYLVEARGEGECPTDALWRDAPLALTLAAWSAVCLASLWTA